MMRMKKRNGSRRRSRAGVLSVVAALTLVAAACSDGGGSDGDSQGKTLEHLTVGSTTFSTHVDPFYPEAASATGLGVETLMKLGPDGSLQPNLAESFDQPDPRTYVYTLRKGVKFWDGNELTADDVVNALDYYRRDGSAAAYLFGPNVASIKATDQHTVEIKLKEVDASWEYTLAGASTGIFEKAFQEEHGEAFGKPGTLTMGTGPWKIDSLDPTQGWEMSANEHYWGGAVPIKRLSGKYFSDESSMALAFRAGEIDVAFPLDAKAFEATSGSKVLSVPSADAGLLSMNTKVEPWDDVHVRRAVAYALDRTDIIAAAGGTATPLTTVIPPSLLVPLASEAEVDKLVKSLPKYDFSLDKARQEMAMSSYPDGFSSVLAIQSSNSEVGQVIVDELKKIGIKAPKGEHCFESPETM